MLRCINSLHYKVRRYNMSNLIRHAKREFLALGYKPIEECEDDPDKWIQENVLELLEVFGKQGHSGFSAPYCISMFSKLAKFEPMCPLQGTDDEWQEVEGNMWQNIRCSSVFKNTKKAWDIDGKVFVEKDGRAYTSKDSSVDITFPYTPRTEYVNVDEMET
jgi:hypothetical protein